MPEKSIKDKYLSTQSEQHYRLTLNAAIAQYKAGLINSTGLLYFYIRIKRAEGWKITLYQKVVCKELSINKSTFYKAIGKLINRGLVIPEESTNITITVNSLQVETEISNCRPESPSGENSLQVETEISNCRPESPSGENQTLKEPPSKKQSDSPNLTDSYQIFNNSLSQEEKERFEKFGRKKASELPNPPTLPQKWIEKHWGELKSEWYKSTGKTPCCEAVQQWESHPKKDEWLAELEEFQNPGMFSSPNDIFDQERENFYSWAYDNRIVSWRKL